MGIIASDLGIDLGTSNTLVYVKRKGIVVSEPTIVVADSTNERTVRAVGDDARIMLENKFYLAEPFVLFRPPVNWVWSTHTGVCPTHTGVCHLLYSVS